MRLGNLINGAGVVYSSADLSTDIVSVVSRAELAVGGSVFVARKGAKYDATADIPFALSRGASAVMVDGTSSVPDGTPTLVVGDILHAEAVVYANFYGISCDKPSVIAVTGTNGKTSVCGLLRAIAEESGMAAGMIGTPGGFVGDRMIYSPAADAPSTTPPPAELYRLLAAMRDMGATSVFMEASSHALAERRLDGIKVKAGIFTNLSRDHLDYHGTMENYLASKMRLFDIAEICLANADDPLFDKIKASKNDREILSFSCIPENYANAEYRACDIIDRGADGLAYRLLFPSGEFGISTPMIGRFALNNTLAAASGMLACGYDPPAVSSAIAKYSGTNGRMEKIVSEAEYGFSVYIDYAHTPDALSGAINALREIMNGRIVVLFGCGGERDRGKRPIMGHIASALADKVIVTDDNPRSEDPSAIRSEILSGADGGAETVCIPNRRTAIEYAVLSASEGDTILLAGKGHEDYEITSDGKHPFSERDIVLSLLGRRT